jgi:hypothetical protein
MDIQTPAEPRLDTIREDPEDGVSKRPVDVDFKDILRAEKGGWPALPNLRQISGATEAIVLFVSLSVLDWSEQ